MNRFFKNTMLAVGLSALLGSLTPLVAGTTQLTADIPFAFHAQGRLMPAGTYQISSAAGQGIFQMSNRSANESEFVNAPVPRVYMPKSSELTFEQHGHEYVLTEISVAGSLHSFGVPATAIEKNLTRKLGLAGMISVPLRSR